MSNLCHFDVEQGRFADAEESVAHALRISEERDTPICTACQLGVRARLRLLQGRWAEAEQDARAVLAVRRPPAEPAVAAPRARPARWPAGTAPPENPHLDELWRLVNRLDTPGMVAPAAAALAENAWITRRPDPRLDEPLVTGLFTRTYAGRDAALAPLRRWSRRLADAGVQQVGAAVARSPRRSRRTSPTSGRWRCGTPGRPTTCWPRSRCSTRSTPARWPRWSGPGCARRA